MPDLISCGLYKQGRSRSAAQRKGCGSTMGPTPKTLKHEWIVEPCLAPRMMILQHSNFLLCREREINCGTAWLSSNGIISASAQRAGKTRNKQQAQDFQGFLHFQGFRKVIRSASWGAIFGSVPPTDQPTDNVERTFLPYFLFLRVVYDWSSRNASGAFLKFFYMGILRISLVANYQHSNGLTGLVLATTGVYLIKLHAWEIATTSIRFSSKPRLLPPNELRLKIQLAVMYLTPYLAILIMVV